MGQTEVIGHYPKSRSLRRRPATEAKIRRPPPIALNLERLPGDLPPDAGPQRLRGRLLGRKTAGQVLGG